MKKIKLTEQMLTTLINKVISERQQIKEQHRDWEVQGDDWKAQKKAREQNKYCKGSIDDADAGGTKWGGHYEGQYCRIETNWHDWESKTVPQTISMGDGGKWSCKLNACIAAHNRGEGEGWQSGSSPLKNIGKTLGQAGGGK